MYRLYFQLRYVRAIAGVIFVYTLPIDSLEAKTGRLFCYTVVYHAPKLVELPTFRLEFSVSFDKLE